MDDLSVQWVARAFCSLQPACCRMASASMVSAARNVLRAPNLAGRMPARASKMLALPKTATSCRSARSSVASRDYNDDSDQNSFGLYSRRCCGGRSGWEIRTDSDAFSTRAERLSPHWPREVDLPQFRHRTRVWRYLQCADGRYESDERRDRVRRFHNDRRGLAD